jgi:hypothetical protein
MFVLSRVKSGHVSTLMSTSMRELPTKPQQTLDATRIIRLQRPKPRLESHAAWPMHIPVPLWALEQE